MKSKFKLITAFMLALTLSGGVYAYTFSTDSGTIAIVDPTRNMATCNATPTQPDWDSIVDSEESIETFRPHASGDETGITYQYPAADAHWDKVDEETADGDSSYVLSNNTNWEEDLYHIPDNSINTGTINYVRVYMVSKASATPVQTSAYVQIKTNGVKDNGTEETLTTSYVSYSYQWDQNPQTSASWTWDEIDGLQIGVGLRKADAAVDTLCTQVYAEVSYNAIPISGSVPMGDLFEVTLDTNYPDYLTVKVYLTNTDNLTKAYQYLNMQLYLENSVEAGETPNYRLLALENGVATFNLEDGASDNQTLSVSGGSYGLNSADSSDWDTGWMVTPEFYCEVTQR